MKDRKLPARMNSIPLREELAALASKFSKKARILDTLILAQMIYWTEVTEKMDANVLDRAEQLKKSGASQWMIDEELSKLRDGWFYKRLEELAEEFFGLVSVSQLSRRLKEIEKTGYVLSKKDKSDKLKHNKWYKADIYKIRMDLARMGLTLTHYPPIPEELLAKEEQEEQAAVEAKREDREDPLTADADPVWGQGGLNLDPEPKSGFTLYDWVNQPKESNGSEG